MNHLEIEYGALTPRSYEIRLKGTLGMESVRSLEHVFQKVFEQGVFQIVVNMEKLSYICSRGIGVLVSSYDKAVSSGGDIVIAAVGPSTQAVFDLIGLAKVIKFAPNTAKASGLLGKPQN